jgi:hypothetical protein
MTAADYDWNILTLIFDCLIHSSMSDLSVFILTLGAPS